MAFTSRKRLKLTIACVFIVFASCKKTDKTLFSYIDSQCPQGGIVNLKKALDVDYDTAFLFGDCINGKDISMGLGITYPQNTFLQDDEYKLILLKNHKIVYDNSFCFKRVAFFFYGAKYRLPNDKAWYYHMWMDSIFVATPRKDISGNLFYQLRPYNDFSIAPDSQSGTTSNEIKTTATCDKTNSTNALTVHI